MGTTRWGEGNEREDENEHEDEGNTKGIREAGRREYEGRTKRRKPDPNAHERRGEGDWTKKKEKEEEEEEEAEEEKEEGGDVRMCRRTCSRWCRRRCPRGTGHGPQIRNQRDTNGWATNARATSGGCTGYEVHESG